MEKMESDRRTELVRQISNLAVTATSGSLSEIYRTCGNAGCRCHGPGPKHGPHLQLVYKGANGKTTGCYVPLAAQEQIRAGVAAWQELQAAIRELGALNRDTIIERVRAAKATEREKRPGTPSVTRGS